MCFLNLSSEFCFKYWFHSILTATLCYQWQLTNINFLFNLSPNLKLTHNFDLTEFYFSTSIVRKS